MLDDPRRARSAFGDHAVLVHEGLVRARRLRGLLRQHLRQHRDALDIATRPPNIGHGMQRDTVRMRIAAERLLPRVGEAGGGHARRKGEIAFGHTARDLQVHQPFVNPVLIDQRLHQRHPLGRRVRRRNGDGGERALQPDEMPVGVEEAPAEDRGHLVDAVAEEQPAIEDRDLRLRLGHELPVQPAYRHDQSEKVDREGGNDVDTGAGRLAPHARPPQTAHAR